MFAIVSVCVFSKMFSSSRTPHFVLLLLLLLIFQICPLRSEEDPICTPVGEESPPLCGGNVFQVYPNVTDGKTPLYFAFMQSFSGGYVSSGGIPAVMVALDEINNRSALLPGYSLHYALSDNACVSYHSQQTLFNQLRERRKKVAVLGSGCSPATEPSAEISHFFNIPQISCHSSSPLLRNRARFRNYFQTIGDELNQARADFGVIKYYGWKRVRILQLDIDTFEKVSIHLRNSLQAINVTVSVKTFEVSEGIQGLGDDPFDDYTIFALIMYQNFARDLLCKAYSMGLWYPRSTFLHPAWWSSKWWDGELMFSNCTLKEREKVVDYSLAVLLFEYIQNDSVIAPDTGIDGTTFKKKFSEHHQNFGLVSLPEENLYGQTCYDATWILALALNKTITELSAVGFDIKNVSYINDSRYLQSITRHLEETNFHGITGHIQFDKDGIRSGTILYMYQNRFENGEYITMELTQPVAQIFYNTIEYRNGASNYTVWPDGIPPDGFPREEIVTVHLSVTVIFVILASVGVVFTIACLIYNFLFRKKKLIRLTSPNLNYIIGAGAILLYLEICLLVSRSTDPDVVEVLCTISPWLASLGYSLCFGTIIAKMIRVFYIFNNPTIRKKHVLKDYHLAAFVLILVVVDVIILFSYTITSDVQNQLHPSRVVNEENPSDTEGARVIETQYFTYICTSKHRGVVLVLLYGYKALIQVTAVILALKTRKVKVHGLDDYREIILGTYFSSFLLIIIIIFAFTIKELINIYAILSSSSFFIGTTMIVALIFVPKMIAVYKDPDGDNVFSKTIPTESNPSQLAPSNADMELLRSKVVELEKRLSKVDGSSLEKKPSAVRFSDVCFSTHSHSNGSSAGLRTNQDPSTKTIKEATSL